MPWGLVTLVGAVVASRLFDLESEGVATIGDVPGGLPPLGLPIIPRDDLGAVVVGGATLALVAMAEGLAATRLFATRGGYRVETEYELVGIGAANIGAGLTGGLGVTGSLSKTAAADQAGSSSQVTGLTAAGIVVLVLLAFTWFFEDLPQAVLSAIVVAAVWGLMDVAALKRFRHVRRADLVAAMVGIAGVVLFGPLPGLGIAIRDIAARHHLPLELATDGGARQDRRRKGGVGPDARSYVAQNGPRQSSSSDSMPRCSGRMRQRSRTAC